MEAMDGKAMIVTMSRRIAVDLYDALIKQRPDWASAADDDDEKGKACVVKVVMTGSADDGPDWQTHIRNKDKRRTLANRFKDPGDPFRIVIVRDMWLTGFDAPCLHTMYADKPMQGHGLMQAIARVNRVFRDKPGGLVVDYLGLADQLKHALAANESAVQAMGDDQLKVIAAELISQVRKSVTIDWTLREGARAKIRVMVKRILNKYGYPPDLQEEAVRTVLMQAELLCSDWVAASRPG